MNTLLQVPAPAGKKQPNLRVNSARSALPEPAGHNSGGLLGMDAYLRHVPLLR